MPPKPKKGSKSGSSPSSKTMTKDDIARGIIKGSDSSSSDDSKSILSNPWKGGVTQKGTEDDQTMPDLSTPKKTPEQPDVAQDTTSGDGLGQPWISGTFPNSTPFSAAESGIQFTSQSGSVQTSEGGGEVATPSVSRKGASESTGGTPSSMSQEQREYDDTLQGVEPEDQYRVLMGGLDELEDDPRDMMLYQIEEAITNIGGTSSVFTREQKMSLKVL